MKKLLCIIGGSYIGGTEQVTLSVLQGLVGLGYKTTCLTNGWNDGEFHKRLDLLSIPFTPLKLGWFHLRKPIWTIDTLFHLPGAIWKASQIIKKAKYDLIYTNSFRQISLLYPLLKNNIYYHAHEPHANNYQFRRFLPLLDLKIKTYFAVSNYIRQDLIDAGVPPNKIVVIHNGVEVPKVTTEKTRQSASSRLVLGIVGQIIPRKGHEDVLSALSILKEKGFNDFQLKIVGKGNDSFENKLRELIKIKKLEQHVAWSGFQQGLQKIYDGIDILLAPTRNKEPFGMIAIEAATMAIPVIATGTGGLAEIIQHQQTGLLINPGNPVELANAILHFAEHPDSINEMGLAGLQRIKDLFTKEQMLEMIHHSFLNTLD